LLGNSAVDGDNSAFVQAAKRQAKGDAFGVDWVVLGTCLLAAGVGDLISYVGIAGVAGMLQ